MFPKPVYQTMLLLSTKKLFLHDQGCRSDRMEVLANFIMRGYDGGDELTWVAVKDRAVDIARDREGTAKITERNSAILAI